MIADRHPSSQPLNTWMKALERFWRVFLSTEICASNCRLASSVLSGKSMLLGERQNLITPGSVVRVVAVGPCFRIRSSLSAVNRLVLAPCILGRPVGLFIIQVVA